MVSVEDNNKTVSSIEFGYEPVSVVCESCSQKVRNDIIIRVDGFSGINMIDSFSNRLDA